MDFTEGADAIELNALAFNQLIDMVNADKALGGSTEPNVVIGYSMGGLVARFGLSYMAKQGCIPFRFQMGLLLTVSMCRWCTSRSFFLLSKNRWA